MAATITVTLPTRWVLVAPCTCPCGVALAVSGDGTVICPTADAAWKSFYSTQRERNTAQREGYVVRAITDDEQERFIEVFTASCPHATNP